MEIEEFIKYRDELLSDSKDEDGFISESAFLQEVLGSMLESKLVDSEDFNDSYYLRNELKIKINGYSVNESGERLHLYMVNEESTSLAIEKEKLLVSLKPYYETQFSRVTRLIQMAFKGELISQIQDSASIKSLLVDITSPEGIEQYDVIEIFLISATATVEKRGAEPQPKNMDFDDDKIKIQYKINRENKTKEIVIIRTLVDLNFLHRVLVSQGNRVPLVVEFEKKFGYVIEAIKAADEKYFESYLCVLPGALIASLYKTYSTRMLEKNVRSFLQFPRKGVNSGMKETINEEPDKFIAYNNGLTITSTGKESTENNGRHYIKSLTDFQIVNGGQTTATIFFSKKEGIPIDKVKVMAKINIAKKATEEELDRLITNISKFSNTQTRVSKVDLRSRSKQLVKLKALSDSIVTPKGYTWFFEKSKGELSTLIRLSGNKDRIIKKYPKERRFTKEELAKYYTAWGEQPYFVKKGGEKVFRDFIEELSGEKKEKTAPEINRSFFENLISRIILFRSMEKIHGEGKKSIGQLRSAVIPYSLSVIYKHTDASKDHNSFNLEKIWLKEGLEQELSDYLYELMSLVNKLIKKYATTDDPSENSKSKELWEIISDCREIKEFISSADTKKILKKYGISKEEQKKNKLKYLKEAEVNFNLIKETVLIHSNGIKFYQHLSSAFHKLTLEDKSRLDEIISSILKKEDIDADHVEFEKRIINKVIAEKPDIFDEFDFVSKTFLTDTLDSIIESYNKVFAEQINISDYFNIIMSDAKVNDIKDFYIWSDIGTLLSNGKAPTIKQIYFASSLLTDTKTDHTVKKKEPVQITTELLTKMVLWDSQKKVLSNGERQYLSELAYGFKKLNSFHENNARRYLDRLLEKGFDPAKQKL